VAEAAIGDGFDEGRAFAVARAFDCGLGDGVDGEDVVAVDAHGGHAIGLALLRDRLRRALLADGHRDGPLVVLAEEDARRAVDRGEVHPAVEVVGRRRAVAHVAEHDDVVAARLGCHRGADCVADLRADHGGHAVVVALLERVVARHLPALAAVVAVADQLVDRLAERQAAHHCGSAFAQRGEHPVARFHRRRRADGRGLLAEDRAVEADASLALQHQHAAIELAHLDHLLVEEQHRLHGQLRIGARKDRAVVAQHAHEAERLRHRRARGLGLGGRCRAQGGLAGGGLLRCGSRRLRLLLGRPWALAQGGRRCRLLRRGLRCLLGRHRGAELSGDQASSRRQGCSRHSLTTFIQRAPVAPSTMRWS